MSQNKSPASQYIVSNSGLDRYPGQNIKADNFNVMYTRDKVAVSKGLQLTNLLS